MEPEYQTVAQTYERLQSMIRQHNDTGFGLAVTDALFEARNPFERRSKRRPRAATTVAAILSLVLALIFAYFSFVHRR